MRIGLDISGGDFAPKATIDGALLAREVLSNDVTIALLGDEELIRTEFANRGKDFEGFEVIHAPEVIIMIIQQKQFLENRIALLPLDLICLQKNI